MAVLNPPWVTTDDLSPGPEDLSDVDLVEACAVASELLYLLSGCQFRTGQAVVRPHRLAQSCGCLPGWGSNAWAAGALAWSQYGVSWGTFSCDCDAGQGLTLPGPDIVSVDKVLVDGVEQTEEVDFFVYDRRKLLRTPDPTTKVGRSFPCCQRLDLESTQPGTLEITYTFGSPPPQSGVSAAGELAYQLALGRAGSDKCQLPKRVVSVTRQGIAMVLVDPQKLLEKGMTGLYYVDLFLTAVNPTRVRRPRVYSPDMTTTSTRSS